MQEKILETEVQEEREAGNDIVQQPDIWKKKRQEILNAKQEVGKAIVHQLESAKCRSDIKDTMRIMAERFGHTTYGYFLSEDDDYQRDHKRIHELEDICMELKIDDEKQEKVCELIREWNEMESHFMANAYLAGMLDSYNLCEEYELL